VPFPLLGCQGRELSASDDPTLALDGARGSDLADDLGVSAFDSTAPVNG